MRTESTEFIINRLANFKNSAEGSILPPQIKSGQRIKNVSSPFIARIDSINGGTYFTIVFDEPPGLNEYFVYWKLEDPLTVNIQSFSGPVSTQSSPVKIFIPGAAGQKVTFYIQTKLSSGLSSEIDTAPSCSSFTI
jgi:hypothetical protein